METYFAIRVANGGVHVWKAEDIGLCLWVCLGCWLSACAPVAFWHVVDYYVQPIGWDTDVLKSLCDAFD